MTYKVSRSGQNVSIQFAVIIASSLAIFAQHQLSDLLPYLSIISGISVGILILGGLHILPSLFISALLTLALLDGEPSTINILFSAIFSFTICLQSASIFMAYRHRFENHNVLRNSKALLIYFGLCFVICLFCSALLAMSKGALIAPQSQTTTVLLTLLLSSFSGILLISPLFLAWNERRSIQLSHCSALEYFSWFALCGISLVYLIEYTASTALAMTPLVLWAALRFPIINSSLAITLCSILALLLNVSTAVETSLLSDWLDAHLNQLQWAFTCMSALYINSLIQEKKATEHKFDELVEERTMALSQANQELQDEIFVREQAEFSQRNISKRYRSLIESAGIPIIVLDKNMCIRQWNQAAEHTFGYTRDAILGKNFIDHFIPQAQQDDMAWKFTQIFESGVNQNNIESETLSYEGQAQTMLWNINPLAGANNTLGDTRYLLLGQNISAIKKTQDQLHYLAHFDSLTGCANRRLFEDRCAQAIRSAARHKHNIALIGLDIDHFKRINDTLGHDAGDEFLVTLASRLKQCVRSEDTIARLGGDEFAVLLVNVNGQEGAEVVARNMLDTITQPIQIKSNELVITSSIGITVCPADGTHYPELLKNADMAMYRAKNAGRNNIQFYSPEMNEEMQRQMLIEQDLRNALKEKQFELYYQPIVNIETGEIAALEALLRWQHPHRGMLRPSYFLDVAEQTGLLNEIGEWVLRKTCEEGLIIQAESGIELQFALNISNRQYNHPNLLKTVTSAIEDSGFNPRHLIIEIAENTLTANSERSRETLNALSNMGLSLSIDSFGTGLSSLRQIKQVPIDIIKIDRSFVNGIPEDRSDMAIAETLLSVATQMDLNTFATGVETRKQEAFLKIHGCRYAQGYLYSPPLPFKQLKKLLCSIQSGEAVHSGSQIYLPFATNDRH